MGDTYEEAVEKVILAMRDNLGEQLTIDDLARVAMFSKFYFTRIFQRVTGVSPGRFLSAMRLAEAKRLLTSSALNVADISVRVGYNSVGTFSSRFSRSVGLSPTTYRRLGGFAPHIATEIRPRHQRFGVVEGIIEHPLPFQSPGLIFMGLFPERVPEGRPVSCTILRQPGAFRFDKVPEGTWYLLAHSIAAKSQHDVRYPLTEDQTLSVTTHGPLTVKADTVLDDVRADLRPIQNIDPPILLALLDVRKNGLAAIADAGGLPD